MFVASAERSLLAVLRGYQLHVVSATAFWMACSVGMLVFNKLAVQVFPLPCLLVALQMAFSALVMLVCCWSSLHFGSWWDVLRWGSVTPFFVGMLLTSMFALKAAPMSLVITFRALSPCFTLAAEQFYPKPTKITLASTWPLGVIALGAVFYAAHMDRRSMSVHGVGWILLNCTFAVCDRTLQRLFLAQDQTPVDISKTGVTLLTNVFGLAPLLCLALFTQEVEQLHDVAARLDRTAALWLAASCLVGVSISYSGILVQSMISATSFLVLINGNKFFIILLEVFVLGDRNGLTKLQFTGAMLTVVGSVLWARTSEGAGIKAAAAADSANRATDGGCGVSTATDCEAADKEA